LDGHLDQIIYDLHCHSSESDGILRPEELVSRAKVQDVSVLALTDHDSISGLNAAKLRAREEGIQIINGIEFSCQWAAQSIHVVALAFDEQHEAFLELIASQSLSRVQRAMRIAERLVAKGIANDIYERAERIADGAAIGRPHFAKALIELGAVANQAQAFKKYLGAGKVGDVKQHWPEFGDVVPIIREAGGVAVLAHPLKYKMTRSKLLRMLADFMECGGEAVEVLSGKQKDSDTNSIARIAKQLGLLASTGSDFHAPGQAWAELGKQGRLPEGLIPVWEHWHTN